MSVLVDTPKEFAGPHRPRNSKFNYASRKRRNQDVLDTLSESDGFVGYPASKMSKQEVQISDVMSRDRHWSLVLNEDAVRNLECSIDSEHIIISSKRSDGSLERMYITLPKDVDPNSICLCFDASNRLLVGFNYRPSCYREFS